MSAIQHAGMKNDMTVMNMPMPPSACETPRPEPANLLVLPPQRSARPCLQARWLRHAEEVRAAQRLRAEVFAAEYGVRCSDAEGLDRDGFDALCEHLAVFDVSTNRLVATTRVLSREAAIRAGGFYSAQEFALDAVLALPGRMLEVGRSCVHADYRSGAAIAVLWSALAAYLQAEKVSYLLGCASISLQDGGQNFARIMPELRARHFVAETLRVQPRRGLAVSEAPLAAAAGKLALPPLLKAYLRMGCQIGGEACWDADFNCADVLVLLDVAAMSARYAQRFLKAG